MFRESSSSSKKNAIFYFTEKLQNILHLSSIISVLLLTKIEHILVSVYIYMEIKFSNTPVK